MNEELKTLIETMIQKHKEATAHKLTWKNFR